MNGYSSINTEEQEEQEGAEEWRGKSKEEMQCINLHQWVASAARCHSKTAYPLYKKGGWLHTVQADHVKNDSNERRGGTRASWDEESHHNVIQNNEEIRYN